MFARQFYTPVSLFTLVAVFTFSLSADSRPGGGAIVMGAARGVGGGGLGIDYTQALKAKTQLDVDWEQTQGVLAITAGDHQHQLKLKSWEMYDLLRIVLDTRVNGTVDVSVDRLAGESRNFFASPELYRNDKISPIGDHLQQADLEFASLASLGPSTTIKELRPLAPGIIAQKLTKSDPDYRLLARDVVYAPFPWPMIEFRVGPLDQADPVSWKATFRPQFITPGGQALTAEPNHPWIEPSMEQQALRPYEPLAKSVGSAAGHELIRKHFPLVAAAERYALSLAALDLHCSKHRRKCQSWKTNLPKKSAPKAKIAIYNNHKADNAQQTKAWNDARIAAANNEPNNDYRCWIFIDEVIYSLSFGPRYSEIQMLRFLPANRCKGSEAGVGVAFLEAALRFSTELDSSTPDTDALRHASNLLKTSLVSIERAKSFTLSSKALWRERAALILARFSIFTESFPVISADIAALADGLAGSCVKDLNRASATARKTPTKRKAPSWRRSLAQLERCKWYPAEKKMLASASFHYAVGVHEAKTSGAEAARHARDRLRMLRSHAAQTRGKNAALIKQLVTKLRRRIRNG